MENNVNFSHFRAENFLLDESFQRFCLGNDEEARKFWTKWVSDNPNKKFEIEKAKELYFLFNGRIRPEEFQVDQVKFKERLLQEGLVVRNEEVPVIGLPLDEKKKRRIPILRFIAAATVLLAISLTALLVFDKNENSKEQQYVKYETKNENKNTNNIAPGGDRAILTLGDGRQIILDTASNGALVHQGGMKVIKIDGKLTYDITESTTEVQYNTVSTPKGGQYQLELADGSKVWLNAASSLRFPTAFVGKERTVELTGEGYFEVAHDARIPFHVKVNEMDVQVLGTHFNINSYRDEPSIKTTLLQGKIRIIKGQASATLKPGEQAELENGALNVTEDVDVNHEMAWQRGFFEFNKTDLPTIMRQISRWYDIDIVYEGIPSNARYGGGLSRNLPLDDILDLLRSNGVKFRQAGKKLVVIP
jgi:transmembrane sensor